MSFVKKFISKQITFTSEETYIEGWNETWKEESKFKKFFKKLFKKDEIKKVVEKNFWSWDNIEKIEPSCSTVNKKEFETTPLLTIEKESPIQEIEISKYKIFISYERFKEYLLDKKIINVGAIYWSKDKRLKNILEFLEAHTRSYFNLFGDSYNYFIQYNTLDLMEHRRRSYENDFKIWFENVNLYCKQFKVQYLWSYTDLENYCNKYLSY
ncbi:hypothetical protein F8M41_011865 [Gigaspora margarita]|uniref:Uncharacterized protein n=1 Tax=Gigaspora margarita TaxID=4874 RepID=A0A8H3WZJ1_GIGMA|nr:hypothetical protein F8M41_011865 [Gigaspora margarita]